MCAALSFLLVVSGCGSTPAGSGAGAPAAEHGGGHDPAPAAPAVGSIHEGESPSRAAGSHAALEGVEEIVAYSNGTCARRRDGSVYCWGLVPDDTMAPHPFATRVSFFEQPMRRLAASPTVLCGIRNDGRIECGPGIRRSEASAENRPTLVEGVRHARALAVGAQRICAITDNGQVWCFRDDDWPSQERVEATQVPGLSHAVEIVSVSSEFCVRRQRGSVICFHRDGVGPRPPEPLSLRPIAGTEDADRLVAADDDFVCAVSGRGVLQCWGFRAEGRHDTGVRWIGEARHVALDQGRICGLLDDQGLRCRDALGNETTDPSLRGAVELSLTASHGCARLADGTVRCWGDRRYGAVGDGVSDLWLEPRRVMGGIRSIEGIDGLLAIVTQEGTRRWLHGGPFPVTESEAECAVGDGVSCCFGRGRSVSCTRPTQGLSWSIAALEDTRALVIQGDSGGCAVSRDDRVRCWGWYYTGNGAGSPSAVLIPGAESLVDVRLGLRVACGRTGQGGVRCWGGLYGGDLGVEEPARSPRAIDVPGIAAARALDCGGGTPCCAAHGEGTVTCWSDGERTSVAVEAAVDVTVQGTHVCARTEAGAVHCWGRNPTGGVGNGGCDPVARPHRVTGLPAVTDVVALRLGTCALTAEGDLYCWGTNDSEMLGLPRVSQASEPTAVLVR